MAKIELYAELLTHIRTVTLVASLETATNDETRIELSGDNQTITISHDGISASLRLPTQMVGGGTAAITLPPRPCKDLTLRLKVEETAPGLLSFEHSDENLVPWPATGMDDANCIRCWRCGTEVVDFEGEDGVREWRDLPNENWAEMMDFWHCHKPHEHGNGEECGPDGEAVDRKGYSASNKLEAKKGLGYVSLSYFILAAEDCKNIEVGPSFPSLSASAISGMTGGKERCSSRRKVLAKAHASDTNAQEERNGHRDQAAFTVLVRT